MLSRVCVIDLVCGPYEVVGLAATSIKLPLKSFLRKRLQLSLRRISQHLRIARLHSRVGVTQAAAGIVNSSLSCLCLQFLEAWLESCLMPPEGSCPACEAELQADGQCPRCALVKARTVAETIAPSDAPPPACASTIRLSLPDAEKPGEWIGRYKLLQLIAEGGMGSVWMAEQLEPVRRRIALKVIKLGMDTKEVIARFEAERQALALMDHPSIAKVFDGGATESGRPFIAMELVRGIKITEYCDENKLSTQQRLDLFVKVCQAVQHAHQKGVIHRDIKPSNILVADHDGMPVPKIIDFGIAKATNGQPLTDKTIFTAFEQFIGTPAYMSPEQAKLTGLDIDTRSDIYSLGVLLYELLTGRTPFDAKRLIQVGLDEIRRIIREEEPPRPSTRLSTLKADEQSAIAHHRRSEPPKLLGLVRGDLDWIVMKCLEKDRTRRYETSNALAMDIQRHMKSEPVVARPPSNAYRFRKLVRRNKFVFAATAAVGIALLLGLIAATWMFVRERQAHQDAQKAQTGEAKERIIAEQRLYHSLVSEARATRIARRVGYRNEVLDLLRQANALNTAQKNLSELRREAVACLGDFVGFAPTTIDHFPAGTTIALSLIAPDARCAAFLLSDGTIQICDLPDGQRTARLKSEEPIIGFCFGKNGSEIISLHWQRATGSQPVAAEQAATVSRWTLNGQEGWRQTEQIPVPGAWGCFSTDHGPLVVVFDPKTGLCNLLDPRDQKVVGRVASNMHTAPRAMAITPDARLLALCGSAEVTVWNTTSGELVSRIKFRPDLDLEVGVFDIALSSDGKFVAWIWQSGCAIYRTEGAEHVATWREFFSRSSLSFRPNRTTLALPNAFQNRLRLWDGVRGKSFSMEAPGRIKNMTFSPDGTLLLVSGFWQAWVYRLEPGVERMSLPTHAQIVAGVDFSPDGQRIATACRDGKIRVWDAVDGHRIWESEFLVAPGHKVCWSPDGRYLVTTTYGQPAVINIRDGRTFEALLEIAPDNTGYMWAPRFSRNSRYLTVALGDGGMGIWSLDPPANGCSDCLPTARRVGALGVNIYNSEFVLDDQHTVILRRDADPSCRLFCWDFANADKARLLDSEVTGGPQTFGISPDKRHVVALDSHRAVVTIDIASGIRLSSFPTLDGELPNELPAEPSLSLSPDGNLAALVTASNRGADIWEVKTGRRLYELPEQEGAVYWLAWSPDGRRLAISDSEGGVAIWNITEIEKILAGLGLGLEQMQANEERVSHGKNMHPTVLSGNSPREARRRLDPNKINEPPSQQSIFNQGTSGEFANVRMVRVVYLVSKDREERADFTEAVESSIKDVQQWYAKQLNGSTFKLHTPVVEVVKASKPADWFSSNPNGSNPDDWGYKNTLAEAGRLFGARQNDPHFIWVIYSDGPGDKGRSISGVVYLPEEDLLGLVGQHPTQKNPERWVGGLAHQLGRAFGLPYPANTIRDADSIMWTGFYDKYPDGTYLTETDKRRLGDSPFFFDSTGQPVLSNGEFVEKYSYTGGFFGRISNSSRSEWKEEKTYFSDTNYFEEVQRDSEFILLRDASRRILVALPIKGGKSRLSFDEGITWQNLYEVQKETLHKP